MCAPLTLLSPPARPGQSNRCHCSETHLPARPQSGVFVRSAAITRAPVWRPSPDHYFDWPLDYLPTWSSNVRAMESRRLNPNRSSCDDRVATNTHLPQASLARLPNQTTNNFPAPAGTVAVARRHSLKVFEPQTRT